MRDDYLGPARNTIQNSKTSEISLLLFTGRLKQNVSSKKTYSVIMSVFKILFNTSKENK